VPLPVSTINTLADACPHKSTIDAICQAGIRCHRPHFLFHREGFTGEHGLVDEEIVGLEHDPICRDQAACREQCDVTRYHLHGRDCLRLAVAQYAGLDGDLGAQFFDGITGSEFLHEAQEGAAQYDGQHDDSVRPLADKTGDNRGKNKDENEGAFELVQQETEGSGLLLGSDRIGAILV
jgi:hypothetical protein